MATKAEIDTVYAAGLVQGIALVTFPAASTIFTSPSQYGLSNTQYGFLFLPQVVTAITTSVLGGSLAARFGTKRVFLAGLAADLASMALLIVSVFFTSSQPVAYGLLLAATACLGAGFGLTAPVINTLTAAFHPGRADASVLVLNALLGLGTTLAPVFVAIFVGLGFWWGLPVTSSVLLLALIAVSAGLPLRAGAPGAAPGAAPARIPPLFWVFAAFAVLYGFCETMNGNWSQLDMTTGLHATATQASLALTAFWGIVTVGRVLFAWTGRWFPPHRTYHALPFLLAIMFVVIALLPTANPGPGHRGFRAGRAGLLRAAAADDQLRPGAARGHGRLVGRRCDRLLPARLRHRGVRDRAAGRRRRGPAGPVRVRGDRRGDHGRAELCPRTQEPRSRRAPPPRPEERQA